MTRLIVNGRTVEVNAEPDTPLLWVLREDLGLTGAKYGCGAAQCGACLVHVDGQPIPSCTTAVSDVEGKAITTIEGLTGKTAEAVAAAWVKLDVAQCGYCQPGQIMAATALLSATPKPSDADIDAVMSRNVCRCGTYQRIRAAIHEAAKTLEG
jgi:isoquinoline 1-oxidoreductase subunit alpha